LNLHPLAECPVQQFYSVVGRVMLPKGSVQRMGDF
jgi:hypothetical protein